MYGIVSFQIEVSCAFYMLHVRQGHKFRFFFVKSGHLIVRCISVCGAPAVLYMLFSTCCTTLGQTRL